MKKIIFTLDPEAIQRKNPNRKIGAPWKGITRRREI